mgnify:CR=1 FL=1
MGKKIAIIGAGATGMTSVKACLEQQLQPIVFEKTNYTGGLWRFKADMDENGIASVQNNSPDEARYEKLTAKNEKPYFNLKAANHQIIGTSQMYASEQSRDKGIESVKQNGSSETIKDSTV